MNRSARHTLTLLIGLTGLLILAACGEPGPAPTTTTYDLTVTVNGAGTVTSDVGGISVTTGDDPVTRSFTENTTVTLTAVADGDGAFEGWEGDCTGTLACVVSLDADASVTANFSDEALEPEIITRTIPIKQGSDDAEEYAQFVNEFFDAGGTQLGSSDLDLTYDAGFGSKVTVGLRFADVNVPSNAVVTNATITFTRIPLSSAPGSITLSFAGEARSNALTFEEGRDNANITTRPSTTATVDWNWAGSWTTAIATSPDLSSIVTEVLQLDGWSSGNAIAFIINSADSDASNYRRAVSFESDPGSAPVLSITYYVPNP